MKLLLFMIFGLFGVHASDLNADFAKFLYENDACSTTEGWVRGEYSCLCQEGALVGCMNNSNCSYISSCSPLPTCSRNEFLTCKTQPLCLQALNCTADQQCQTARMCMPVMAQRKVCSNETGTEIGNNNTNVINITTLADNKTTQANETNLTSIAAAAPGPAVMNNGSMGKNETLPAGTCWIESYPGIECQNITRCYPSSQCAFQPKCLFIINCTQNGTCQDSNTCMPEWTCG